MKFFADTASLNEIAYCFSRGVDDGITTNPKIMETTGDLSQGFEGACRSITEKYPHFPISLETDLRGIDVRDISAKVSGVRQTLLEQAYPLSRLGENVVVKIPICAGGLEAVAELEAKGVRTNVTACMTPYQALKAAEAGASFVSLFSNRMLDAKILELAGYSPETILLNSEWKNLVKQSQSLTEEAWQIVLGQISYVASRLDLSRSNLIVGSIRSPSDIIRLVKAEPQIITIPHKIVTGLDDPTLLKKTKRSITPNAHSGTDSLYHPMTEYTLEEFERAADVYRKN
jgi:transaldolase